jgi:LysR family transcriptional regulator, hydrogen peroxide-inducible genes activator
VAPVEIQQARYFVALCETLNFTRAAERCNVTQPSLTRAVRLLEEQLGGPLFNRERNNTHLTELGRLVEPHVRELMAQAQTARSRAAAFLQLRSARLKVGITRGVPLSPLDDTLGRYAASYPDTEVEISDDRAPALRDALRRGELEVVVLPTRPADIDDLHYHPIAEGGPRLVVRADHPLAGRTAVPLAEVGHLPLICGAGCQFWEAAERRFAELGAEVRPRVVAGSIDWTLDLVAAGVGVGLTAYGGGLPPGLVGVPVEAPPLRRVVSLATKRGRLYSPPVKAFVDLVLQPGRRRQAPSAVTAPAA